MTLPRFYPILDTGLLTRSGMSSPMAAKVLLEGGARILQFRHKGNYSQAILEEAEHVAAACREAGALFVVNDRADIAALIGAALHLGQDDLSPSDARKLLPGDQVIGVSTHNEGQLASAAAEPVDYLALGPVFQTGSKQNPDPVLGLARFAHLRRLTSRPLVAIGGITRASAAEVWAAGADSIAVIGDLFPPSIDPHWLRDIAEEWCSLAL